MCFVAKSNEQLRMCVNYRKLNALIKKNRYLISLIDETLIKVIESKYIFKLDIIAIFNKLRVNLVSEKYTTFICVLSAYKYHVLFFELSNDSVN